MKTLCEIGSARNSKLKSCSEGTFVFDGVVDELTF